MGLLNSAPTVRNWSGCAQGTVAATTPHTEDELAHLVADRARAGQRIRVIGAGHSFTPIAMSNDTVINIDALAGVVSVDRRTKHVRLKAGTRLRDIPALLAPYGLALANQGDVNPQSLAGAISTGTHGTGLGFTGFAGTVTGIRLMGPDGNSAWLSAEHNPEVFDLARLSIGLLGVITEVEMQCVDAFDLIANEHQEPLPQVLESFVERSREHDHVEFYFFPHTDRALVKTNERVARGQAGFGVAADSGRRSKIVQILSEELIDNGALRAVCEIGARFPSVVPTFNRLAAAATSGRTYRAPAHEVFVSPRRVRFNEMEYAVPLEHGPEVVARINELINASDWKISFPIEVRTAKADDVPLSTAYGRDSCYIAIHRMFKEPYAEYFHAVEDIMAEYDGRPHWGKLHTLGAEQLSQLYPRFEDFRELRARLDPEAVFGNDYTDSLMGL